MPAPTLTKEKNMLKAGIFLDIENLSRNGGWGMRYDSIKSLVEAQGATVLRANAYLAIDRVREEEEPEYRQRNAAYRDAVRRNGFHLVLKEVQRYRDADGQLVLKANADLDLAVDALLQADNLDYILLGSGDGDFIRLVRALQDHGKRVDGISFAHTSTALRNQFDHYYNGALIPGVLPATGDNGHSRRQRGFMHTVFEDKGYGFLTVRTGYRPHQTRHDIFCHISDFTAEGEPVDNASFSYLKESEAIIEFDLVEQADGKVKAVNACEFDPLGER